MSQGRSHDAFADLLGAYALDAVDPDERALVEDHLSVCPKCAAEVAEHREVAALLAHSGGDAPQGVWNNIADSLAEEPPPLSLRLPDTDRVLELGAPPAVDDAAPASSAVGDLDATRRRRRWIPVAALGAAAVVVVVALLAAVLLDTDSRLKDIENDVAARIDDLADVAFEDGSSTVVNLRSEDGSVSAAAVVAPDGSGFLRGDELPSLASGRTYQLWGVRGEVVFSLGVLGRDPGVVTFFAADGVDALVLTDEVEGGVPQSGNPPLYTGELS